MRPLILISILLGACPFVSFGDEGQAPLVCGVRMRDFSQALLLPGEARVLIRAQDACAPKPGMPFELYEVEVQVLRRTGAPLRYRSEYGFLSPKSDAVFLKTTPEPVWIDLDGRQVRSASHSAAF